MASYFETESKGSMDLHEAALLLQPKPHTSLIDALPEESSLVATREAEAARIVIAAATES